MKIRMSMALFFSSAFFLVANSIPFAVAAPLAQKEWTFLVYINGHNNLDSYGKLNIKQMERVGSSDQVNVVVQWASMAASKTKRLYITKSNNQDEVTSPVVDEPGLVDMGDYKNLIEFARWGIENYPAKHYFISVWNHGSGWHEKNRKDFSIKDISFDDRFYSKITTRELGEAMDTIASIIGHKVDVYGSDACLMAMAEIAGEMKNSVEVFVGSQELEPGEGWPYDQLLKEWVQKPTMSAEEVGTTLSKEYLASYSGGQNGSQEVTFSALDLKKWDALENAAREFSGELSRIQKSPMQSKILNAMKATQYFDSSDYKDLLDFLKKLEAQQIQLQAQAQLKAAAQAVVLNNSVSTSYQRAMGISVWLPTQKSFFNGYLRNYQNLDWNKNTSWSSFLANILQ